MKLRLPRWVLFSLLAPVALGIVFIYGGVNAVLSMNGAEGGELSKALLLVNHHDALTQAGQDHPAFYVKLLALLFQVFGHDATPARLLTLISTIAMLVALGWLLHQEIGYPGLVSLGIFLFTANVILPLAMTALPNLVSVSWAVVAVAISYNSIHPPNKIKLLLSGVVWAFAVQVNATALLVWPAFSALCVRQWGWKSAAYSCGICLVGFIATLMFTAELMQPGFNLKSLFISGSKLEWVQPQFLLHALLLNPGILFAVVIGVLLMIQRKTPGPLLFATIWLGSALIWVVLQGGCPQPDTPKIYVPLAILASAGFAGAISEAMKPSFHVTPPTDGRTSGLRYGKDLHALGAVTVFAFWAGFAVPNLIAELKDINQLPNSRQDGLCSSIRKYAPETHWCYTRFPAYAFAGGVILPPEMATVRQTDTTSEPALKLVQHYQPEQLLLEANGEMQDKAWIAWTTNHYVMVDRNGEKELWVSRRLHPEQIQSPNDFLKKLGL